MVFRKAFSKRAKADGRLIYRKRRRFIMPMTVRRTVVTLEGAASSSLAFSCFIDGALVAEGSGPGDRPFVFTPGLRLPRGEREFLLVTEGFPAHHPVQGSFEVDVSFF